MVRAARVAHWVTCWGCVLITSLILLASLAACNNYKAELSRKGINYSTESFLAQAAKGDLEAVESFIKAGMGINAQDSAGHTALMFASAEGQTGIASLLVEKGAGINIRDNGGYTALMYAVSKGRWDTAKLLIDKGADVNASSNQGFTPLMVASATGNTGLIDLLRKSGAKH